MYDNQIYLSIQRAVRGVEIKLTVVTRGRIKMNGRHPGYKSN